MDASAILTLCFEDEDNAYGQRVLDAAEAGAAIVVPSVWPLEVGNGLLVAERRGRLDGNGLARFLALLGDLGVSVDQGSLPYTMETTLPLARKHRLTVYDAAYLELALREQCPLATLDRRLIEACAAASAGVL